MDTKPRVNDNISLDSILLTTDFSKASLRALPYARQIAHRFGSKLYIAHIVPPEDYPSGLNSIDEAAQVACGEAQLRLRALVESAPFHEIPHETFVGYGDIWIGLTAFMHQHAIDLLVMGTNGRSGLKKFLLGSVAEEAMRESRCPVLTVGPEIHSAEHPGFRQILYATDFSAESVTALPYALSLSEKFSSRLTLVHVLEGLPASPYLDAQMARVRLRELVPRRPALRIEPGLVVEMGAPPEVILKAAEDAQSELIVIGARGAGALARLASHFGSVAHKIVCRAFCPVLTVRPSTDGEQRQ